MVTQLAEAGRQDTVSTILGWLIFLSFFVLFFNIINLPRTPLDLREPLRVTHDTLGLVVMLLALIRLYWFWRGPAPSPPPGLPPGSFAFNRAILLALILTFAAEGIIGYCFAWGETDRSPTIFGWVIPQLLPEDDAVRKPAGYLHSALGFYYLMLLSIWIAFGLYQHVRYKAGLLRLLPGFRV